jgi:hypothetical protein
MTKNFRYSKPALNCIRSTRQMACLNGSTAKSSDIAWTCTVGGNANASKITAPYCKPGSGAISNTGVWVCKDGLRAVNQTTGSSACSAGNGSAQDADGRFCNVGTGFL